MDVETSLQLDRIRETLSKYLHPLEVRLFGSRATGLAETDSDFDLLVVVADGPSKDELLTLSSLCRRELARRGIDADVLIRTQSMVEEFRDKPGSLIRSALVEGVEI